MAYPKYIPFEQLVPFWPTHLCSEPPAESLAIVNYEAIEEADELIAYLDLAIASDLSFSLTGLDSIELILPGDPDNPLTVEAILSGAFEVRIDGFDLHLRILSSLLVPVTGSYPDWQPLIDEAGDPEPIELAVTIGSLIIDEEFQPRFELEGTLSLGSVMIGDTGIVLDITAARLVLSANEPPPEGQAAGFRGIVIEEATVYLPPTMDIAGINPEAITLSGLAIGHGGISGLLSGHWSPVWDDLSVSGDGSGTIFGFPFALRALGFSFSQNSLTGANLEGELGLPFFDVVVAVTASFDVGGVFSLELRQQDENGSDAFMAADQNGILTIVKEGLGTFALHQIGVEVAGEASCLVLGGSVTLEVGAPAIRWPEITFSDLCIGPHGEVSLSGGWIDLQEPVTLNLYGFLMEISQIGFGNEEDGRRWVGFSGAVTLTDFLPTGVSVEGLRVLWNPDDPTEAPDIRFQGIGLALAVPGVFTLDGDVALVNENGSYYFEGNAFLELEPLGIGLDVSLLVGHDDTLNYNYLYVFLGVELPVGIPLWATGAALYGIQGLYGQSVAPALPGSNQWYEWYSAAPAFDVSDTDKWQKEQGGFAVGAGLVLGTLFDGGFVVSTKALLVLLLPGPVLMFHGKADILHVPPELSGSDEGTMSMLLLLDPTAGFMQLNIDATWGLPKVAELAANAEAYFDLAQPADWHLYIGQDSPESRRVRADLLLLWHGDAYLMIDGSGIAAGFAITWGDSWKFTPVTVTLKAWLTADAALTWRPPQLEGSVGVGGEISVKVALFEVGLAADACLSAKTPKPYQIEGTFTVIVKLPAPIKDFEEDIHLEWGKTEPPPLEDPFDTAGVEHLKVTESWRLEAGNAIATPSLATGGPVVPLDARPLVTFTTPSRTLSPRPSPSPPSPTCNIRAASRSPATPSTMS